MLEVESLKLKGVRHGFFTRKGGLSSGVYDSLNIGLGSDDERANVIENRRRAAERLGVRADALALPYQYHSPDAVIVEEAWSPAEAPKADAVVTNVPGLAVAISTADCGPVLMADVEARVVAAAHAGWRGAIDGVIETTLVAMEELGAARDRIVAVLGPTISQASYEVGPEFRETFIKHDEGNGRFFIDGPAGKPHFDLPAYILHRLEKAGVRRAEWIGRCTYAEEESFFSYRRATHRGEPDYGRLISAITLTE